MNLALGLALPDGRWLASAAGEDGGTRLYDSGERRLLAALPECMGRIVLFEPSGKSLLTGGAEGIIRWPIVGKANDLDYSVAFGEPQPISSLKEVLLASLSLDGRWLACTGSPDAVWLLDLTDPDRPILLGRHRSALAISISPDGQWVASGNWHGNEGVKIWQTSTRRVVKTVPMGLVNLGRSPDGSFASTGWACQDDLEVWEESHRNESDLTSFGPGWKLSSSRQPTGGTDRRVLSRGPASCKTLSSLNGYGQAYVVPRG